MGFSAWYILSVQLRRMRHQCNQLCRAAKKMQPSLHEAYSTRTCTVCFAAICVDLLQLPRTMNPVTMPCPNFRVAQSQ